MIKFILKKYILYIDEKFWIIEPCANLKCIFEDPNIKFGVNCYGYKPKISSEEQEEMDKHNIVPKNKKDIKFDKLVKKYRSKLKNILVSPFNYDQWSYI